MRVALLTNDLALSWQIESVLKDATHTCALFSTIRALTTSLRHDSYDLLLLDWSAPEQGGLLFLQWIRQNVRPCPLVLIVTDSDRTAEIVAALQAGADDCLAKPIVGSLLMAKLAALLRRTGEIPSISHGRE